MSESGSPATFPSITLESWTTFLHHVGRVGWGLPTRPGHVFRGQSKAKWTLEPKLLRELRGAKDRVAVLALEDRLDKEFFAQAHLHPEYVDVGADPLSNWMDRAALMQHYGAPTRLLDWSVSPYVAAYFACAEHPEDDGAVFVVSPVALSKRMPPPQDHELLNAWMEGDETVRHVWFFPPSRRFTRQVSQLGHFSVSADVMAIHDPAIIEKLPPGSAADGPGLIAAKWIIPSASKRDFLGALRQVNVSGFSLFGGLDGLGRSIREIAVIERKMIR